MITTSLGQLIDIMPDWGTPKSPKKVKLSLAFNTENLRSTSCVTLPAGTSQRIGKRVFPRIQSVEYQVPFKMSGVLRNTLWKMVGSRVIVPAWCLPLSVSATPGTNQVTVSTTPGSIGYAIPGLIRKGAKLYGSDGGFYTVQSITGAVLTLDGAPTLPCALYPVCIGYLKSFNQPWTNRLATNELTISVVEGSRI